MTKASAVKRGEDKAVGLALKFVGSRCSCAMGGRGGLEREENCVDHGRGPDGGGWDEMEGHKNWDGCNARKGIRYLRQFVFSEGTKRGHPGFVMKVF
jgi:hypothetical protein